jgi:hypothetical protein
MIVSTEGPSHAPLKWLIFFSRLDLMAIGFVFTVALSVATMMCGWYGAGAHGKSTERHSAFRR